MAEEQSTPEEGQTQTAENNSASEGSGTDEDNGEETAAQAEYNEAVATKLDQYTKTVTSALEAALDGDADHTDLKNTTYKLYEAFGEADRAPYASSDGTSSVTDGTDGQQASAEDGASEEMDDTDDSLDSSSPSSTGTGTTPFSNSPWESGVMDKWLDAAADALCPNGNCDYSPELDQVGTTAGVAAAATGAATGAVAGAKLGTTAGVVGAAAGAAVGAVAGAVAAATGHGITSGAPWKANTEPRAKIVFSEGDVRRSFKGTSGLDPDEWDKYAMYNSVEFGYFDFKFYSKDELETKFGELGKVDDNDVDRFGCYLADPFYRKQSKEAQAEYVYKCTTDYKNTKKAFYRICLMYLYVLITYNIIPSFSYDVFRGAIKDHEMMQKVLTSIQNKRDEKAKKEEEASEKGKQKATSLRHLQRKAEKAAQVSDEDKKAMEDAQKAEDDAKKKLEEAQKKQQADGSDANNKAVEDAQKAYDKAKEDNQKKKDEVSKKQEEAKAKTSTDPQLKDGQQSQAMSLTGVGQNASSNSGDGSLAFEQYVNLFKKNQGAVDNGKTFLMVLLGVLDGDSNFMKILLNRNYSALNNITHGAMTGNNSPVNSGDDGKSYMGKARSFIRALAGEKVIDEAKIGAGETQEPSSAFSQFNGRKNIAAAADDPSKYMVHSFYDMVVHDCRGRMLRAFPTFYMILIDEGRKIGRWKLHDNFYNVNSISSITVSKSRKMPTDTAEIVMSNFYNTFTDNDENLNNNYTANFTDVFRSIWLPAMESYAKDQENKRENAGDPERFRLRAGARVHIRFGYGADASALPTTFNGVVAECETSDTVTLICQSDGVEICKPIMLDKEAWDLPGIDNLVGFQSWGQNGATPKQIMASLLNYKGGAINSYMHDQGWDDAANMIGDPVCPLGIYHFGNPDINYGGEPETMQNILEVGMANPQDRYCPNPDNDKSTVRKAAEKGMKYGAAGAAFELAKGAVNYVMEPQEPPRLNFEVFGKTVWDVLNIVKSVEPSYYAAVVPFHLRSSIFMGRGHDYYAYDYENQGGQWVEKRKPYQQNHIYDSHTDIITNSMKVSTKDIKTCAVGMYEVSGFMNAKVQKKTDPQWVDANIYPEYQKTMYVDTKLFGEPSRKLGKISDAINALLGGVFNSTLDRAFDDKGDCQNHHAMAVKMTIDALKQQMKEMYAGQMTIIGDPTVKPNDRLLINDTYDGIAGQCLVRDVVQVFSADAGYKTVITPDLITAQTGQDAAEESKAQEYGLLAINSALGIAAANIFMHFSHKTADQVRKVTAFVEDKAPKLGRAVGNKASTTITQIKNSNKLTGLGKGAGNLLGPLKNVKALQKVGSAAGTALEVGAAVAKGAWTISKAANIPLAVVSTLGLAAAEDFVTSKVQSRKRLVLFPLQKYNKPMVGGIDGNVGTVYGSPNFDPSEESLSKLAGGLWKRMTGSQKESMQDGMQSAAERQKQMMEAQQKMANSDEGKAQLVYRKLNNSQIEFFRNAYFNPAKTRLEVHKQSSVKKAQMLYGVYGTDQDGINDNPNFQKMRPVIGDKRLKDSMDLGFFRVAAFERGFTSEISDKVRCMYIKDQKTHEYIPVNAIVDGNGTIDIPYLHGEALGVLCDVIKRAFNYMAGTEQSRDAAKWYKDNAESFITLTSALKCGSPKNYEATGFSFVLTASDGKSLLALTSATDQLNSVMAQGHAQAEQIPDAIMDVKTTGQDVFIVVHPPEDAG